MSEAESEVFGNDLSLIWPKLPEQTEEDGANGRQDEESERKEDEQGSEESEISIGLLQHELDRAYGEFFSRYNYMKEMETNHKNEIVVQQAEASADHFRLLNQYLFGTKEDREKAKMILNPPT